MEVSRPMAYKYLTVQMNQSVRENGIINQTIIKTNEKYGFDLFVFSVEVLTIINDYINYIKPRINPIYDYVSVCRNGTQYTKLSK